ncbi:uncharacterized protein PV07_08425 [Cladophialophora immunda]|uniref:Uncharacterized protein n=1 Tax=Cladophialophora immunda TaxID=569365 RepID=A0A0D2CNW2_9EURO|nr:uncharacterized protein PV07_08425 [Cladophialophora immunda]KIW25229.1 hypothetical protein PV07_08425 [Cladophialophora immunda]
MTRRSSITVAIPDRETRRSELKCISLIEQASGATISITRDNRIPPNQGNLLTFLRRVSKGLQDIDVADVVGALEEVVQRCVTEPDFGGYGLIEQQSLQPSQEADVLFLCSALLEALKSAARARARPPLFSERPKGRRGMTIAEKIFAMHDVSRRGFVMSGDIIQVDVDWVLASELSWQCTIL